MFSSGFIGEAQAVAFEIYISYDKIDYSVSS